MTPPSDTRRTNPSTAPAPRGGFDCVLGNPPWERVKLQEKEWFAERVPEIANAPNAAARGRLIAAIATDRPGLHQQFLADRRSSEAASSFLRSSGRFPLCGRGDVNLYTVFAESMRDGLSPRGRAGMIVPSGIATDDTTKHFFQDLVGRASLASFYDFENREGLFEAVDSRMKFACVTLRAPAPDEAAAATTPPAEFVFFAHRVEDLDDPQRRFTLSREDIALVNPNTRTCPIFRSKVDAELTKHIYRRVPVLVDETKPDGNPWGVTFSTMFHMSNDSGLFRTREQLEADGWALRGNVFERRGERYLPLYEAKMCSPFDHRTADVVKSATAVDRQNQAAAFDDERKRFADSVPLSLYWVPFGSVTQRAGTNTRWLAGWRNVTSPTNERTALACFLPLAGVGHSQPLVRCSAGPPALTRIVSALSSFSCDFFVRQKLGGVNFTFGVMQQVLVPRSEIDLSRPGVLGLVGFRSAIELSATADDMAPFSRDLWPEGDGAVFRWDPDRRFEIRCELDAAFFHLYLGNEDEWRRTASPELLAALPTPRHAVEYIMESFPIVKRKDEEAHGRYRTKERILVLYDRLQACLARGTAFTSELDPPPGPPTNPDGSFRRLPAWPPGTPRPADYPPHIHPPASHRTGIHHSSE